MTTTTHRAAMPRKFAFRHRRCTACGELGHFAITCLSGTPFASETAARRRPAIESSLVCLMCARPSKAPGRCAVCGGNVILDMSA